MPDLPRRAGSCAAGGHPTTPSALWALPHVNLLRGLFTLSFLPAASPCSTASGVLRPHPPPTALVRVDYSTHLKVASCGHILCLPCALRLHANAVDEERARKLPHHPKDRTHAGFDHSGGMGVGARLQVPRLRRRPPRLGAAHRAAALVGEARAAGEVLEQLPSLVDRCCCSLSGR